MDPKTGDRVHGALSNRANGAPNRVVAIVVQHGGQSCVASSLECVGEKMLRPSLRNRSIRSQSWRRAEAVTKKAAALLDLVNGRPPSSCKRPIRRARMNCARPRRGPVSTDRVTDLSRIRGTSRTREDIEGHDRAATGVRKDPGGTSGTREDTTYVGFGTVRPRVQIPGPRPSFALRVLTFEGPSLVV